MTRGFGIDASVPVDVAVAVAKRAQQLGYSSFWVNGSPHNGAIEIIDRAAKTTDLDLGVGVFPLTRISADELVSEVLSRDIPQDRLWLGVGSGRRPGALAEVRHAVEVFHDQLNATVVTAAVGPKMTALAGEVADAVIFTWWTVPDVVRSRQVLEESAADQGREVPTVVSFIRCALLPQAADAVAQRAEVYGAIPHYAAVFERNNQTASDTVVTGKSSEELLAGIEREESVLDVPVIRAIPAEDTVESLTELLEACAP